MNWREELSYKKDKINDIIIRLYQLYCKSHDANNDEDCDYYLKEKQQLEEKLYKICQIEAEYLKIDEDNLKDKELIVFNEKIIELLDYADNIFIENESFLTMWL